MTYVLERIAREIFKLTQAEIARGPRARAAAASQAASASGPLAAASASGSGCAASGDGPARRHPGRRRRSGLLVGSLAEAGLLVA